MGRFFNTTGPVVAADHYCIPPLDRLDLREVLDLVRRASRASPALHPRAWPGRASTASAGAARTSSSSGRSAANGAETGGAAGGRERKFVIECKVLHRSLERTIRDGLEQTAAYMDRCAAEAGHLVVFDRGDGTWDDKIFHRPAPAGGPAIDVWGM